jgi:hypothetical protein
MLGIPPSTSIRYVLGWGYGMPLPKLQSKMNKKCLCTTSFKGLIGLKMLLKETDKEYPPPIII